MRIAPVAALLALAGVSALEAAPTPEHERLRLRNDLKTPAEVVRYYCGRDASGFVWSGLLDSERKAFTTWTDVPQQDSFFIAKSYEVIPRATEGDRATVEVKYEVTGIGDAHGTRLPPPAPELRVVFDLKRVNGAWKIARPEYTAISPVVLESKFPGL
jgi:hypothetical protein